VSDEKLIALARLAARTLFALQMSGYGQLVTMLADRLEQKDLDPEDTDYE
jgi:hypothetical protein